LTEPRLTHITNDEAAIFPGVLWRNVNLCIIAEITLHYNHNTKVTSFTARYGQLFPSAQPETEPRTDDHPNPSDFPGGNLT
jgi:hypothetical protein